jgi:hypothetical protein
MLLGLSIVAPGAGGPLVAAGIWVVCLWLLARSCGWLSLQSLFLLLLGLFHLGMIVPVALGVRPVPDAEWLHSPHVAKSIGLFSIGTLAFTIGVRPAHRAAAHGPGSLSAEPHLFGVGSAVAACGAALLWVGVMKTGMLSMTYADYFERSMSEDVRFVGLGMMLFPIGVLVTAVGATPRQMLVPAAMLALVLGPLLFAGFRGHFIVHAMVLLAVWFRKDARLARRLAILGGIAVLVLAPGIKSSRNRDTGLSVAVSGAQPLEFLLESGGSLRPLVATAEQVESWGEPLWMGRSYLMAAGRVVPNISTKWTPPGKRALSPSSWVTLHEDRWLFEHGGGVGFSGIAEPYLNFGWPGVAVYFLLLGYASKVGDRWLSGDPFRAALVASSYGFVLWTVRNDVMAVPRAVVLATAAVAIGWLIASLRSRRKIA